MLNYGARPARGEDGSLTLPDLTGLGISKNTFAKMQQAPVTFDGHFCLTGVFALGERDAVEAQIAARGGLICKKVRKTGCTLVLGTGASEGWSCGTFGNKLIDAAEAIRKGNPVRIITEDVLAAALCATPEVEGETPQARAQRYTALVKNGDLTEDEAAVLRENFL